MFEVDEQGGWRDLSPSGHIENRFGLQNNTKKKEIIYFSSE